MDHSVFDSAWNEMEGTTCISLNKMYELLAGIESELQIGPFLSQDGNIDHQMQAIITELQNKLGQPSETILIPKDDMFQIIKEVLRDIKIFDYSTHKVFGNFNDNHTYYQDQHNCLIEKLDDDYEDYDETESLMEAPSLMSSPSSILSEDPRSMVKSIDNDEFELKKSLEDLQIFHITLQNKFRHFDKELRLMSVQNNLDLKHLHKLTSQNNRMIERVDSIRLELAGLSSQSQEINPDAPLIVYVPCQVDYTTTQFSDEDLLLLEEIRGNNKTSIEEQKASKDIPDVTETIIHKLKQTEKENQQELQTRAEELSTIEIATNEEQSNENVIHTQDTPTQEVANIILSLETLDEIPKIVLEKTQPQTAVVSHASQDNTLTHTKPNSTIQPTVYVAVFILIISLLVVYN